MGEPRVLVIHPPVSVARDFIDYPYFSDLGAVQLAAVVAAQLGEDRVELVLLHGFIEQPDRGCNVASRKRLPRPHAPQSGHVSRGLEVRAIEQQLLKPVAEFLSDRPDLENGFVVAENLAPEGQLQAARVAFHSAAESATKKPRDGHVTEVPGLRRL